MECSSTRRHYSRVWLLRQCIASGHWHWSSSTLAPTLFTVKIPVFIANNHHSRPFYDIYLFASWFFMLLRPPLGLRISRNVASIFWSQAANTIPVSSLFLTGPDWMPRPHKDNLRHTYFLEKKPKNMGVVMQGEHMSKKKGRKIHRISNNLSKCIRTWSIQGYLELISRVSPLKAISCDIAPSICFFFFFFNIQLRPTTVCECLDTKLTQCKVTTLRISTRHAHAVQSTNNCKGISSLCRLLLLCLCLSVRPSVFSKTQGINRRSVQVICKCKPLPLQQNPCWDKQLTTLPRSERKRDSGALKAACTVSPWLHVTENASATSPSTTLNHHDQCGDSNACSLLDETVAEKKKRKTCQSVELSLCVLSHPLLAATHKHGPTPNFVLPAS